MLLKDLLADIYHKPVDAQHQLCDIRFITCDSRTVAPFSIFFAVKGAKLNGLDYIPQAIQQGAVCIVKDADQRAPEIPKNICVLEVDDVRSFLNKMVHRFYHDPSSRLSCVGITGTNGKTTTTYLMESVFKAAQKSCGIVGTINCRFGHQMIPLNNTTPNLFDLCSYLSQMEQAGCNCCAMEVSSHALDQGRVDGVDFRVGVFTNLTQDHLDYHRDMENYFLAKAKLFSSLSTTAVAVVNIDDAYGKRLMTLTKAKVLSYGLKEKSFATATNIQLGLHETSFVLTLGSDQCRITTKLIGTYNIYNILAASAACHALGIKVEDIRQGIENMVRVPGRLELVDCGQSFSVFVDYAHTDDALKNVLENIRTVKKTRIILVFGCGGDRDKTKRAKMGRVASDLADFSILTNDNPRSENPQEIVEKIVTGFSHDRYLIILNRKDAIARALAMAQPNDVVLIAGKGHENYQIIKDQKMNFDDREVAREILRCSR